jgi:hypothetical protein
MARSNSATDVHTHYRDREYRHGSVCAQESGDARILDPHSQLHWACQSYREPQDSQTENVRKMLLDRVGRQAHTVNGKSPFRTT